MIDGITSGQIWWDKDRKWCDGSDYLNIIFVVLSGDRRSMDDQIEWKLANFMWCKDGYCGADIRVFNEKEIKMMSLIGNLSDIKKFYED